MNFVLQSIFALSVVFFGSLRFGVGWETSIPVGKIPGHPKSNLGRSRLAAKETVMKIGTAERILTSDGPFSVSVDEMHDPVTGKNTFGILCHTPTVE
jgi:hypothetical protein